MADNTHHADYNSPGNSWVEQRTFVTQAPALLEKAYPALAKNLTEALAAIATVVPPTADPSMKTAAAGTPLKCGAWTVKLGATGAITSLVHSAAKTDWAAKAKPLGEFKYQTFTSGDFNLFLQDFESRIGDHGVWPEHTVSKTDELFIKYEELCIKTRSFHLKG